MLYHNIVLIGPMGTGKSTIGKIVSNKFKCKFYDIDKEIEKKCGCKIYDIFLLEGENSFRKREHKIIKDFSKKNGVVISTGGGSIINLKNIQLLRNNSIVIYLYTSVYYQIQRIQRIDKIFNNRPLLKGKNYKKKLYNIFKLREPFYHYIADIIINTEKKIEVIIKEIKKRIYFIENH
ncbi:Shikimate kinase [Candidatus Portiera aleyrodidarum]|uniref:Shikimate kinase n=1 Tax=Candidatus Portiera aleyrodidarum TV TaxID=1297582 RepID=A0A8D3X6N5_9GAMM|nr:shikimate kinase [Candidatus Portiera aleyrodidarum]AGI27031.1 shikimate kinase [Candidatus Portiera aleyrodidarum TV]CEI58987.1 Shikimate kinase [Candidatus Portiera aleyrodidarum]